MITPDANIILYAYNKDAPKDLAEKVWLEEQFSFPDVFGLSWQVITAFLRISTNPRAFPQPFDLHEAIDIVDEWLKLPNIKILNPVRKSLEDISKFNQRRTNQSRINDGRASCRVSYRTRRNTRNN